MNKRKFAPSRRVRRECCRPIDANEGNSWRELARTLASTEAVFGCDKGGVGCVNPSSGGHVLAANQGKSAKLSDRAWTRVAELVFAPCSHEVGERRDSKPTISA